MAKETSGSRSTSTDYVWITWLKNGRSKFNGQTDKVLKDSIVDALPDPQSGKYEVGQRVTVYWEYQKVKYWTGIIAAGKQKKLKPHEIVKIVKDQKSVSSDVSRQGPKTSSPRPKKTLPSKRAKKGPPPSCVDLTPTSKLSM